MNVGACAFNCFTLCACIGGCMDWIGLACWLLILLMPKRQNRASNRSSLQHLHICVTWHRYIVCDCACVLTCACACACACACTCVSFGVIANLSNQFSLTSATLCAYMCVWCMCGDGVYYQCTRTNTCALSNKYTGNVWRPNSKDTQVGRVYVRKIHICLFGDVRN